MSKVPILTVAVVLVVWVALTAYDMRDGAQPAVAPMAPPELLGGIIEGVPQSATPSPTVQAAQRIDYAELLHNTGSHVGRAVYREGRVARIAERLPGALVLQVEVTHGADDAWDDTVYVTWEGQEPAEYELIRLWGTVSGRASHEGALGTRPTLPEIAATVLQKAE